MGQTAFPAAAWPPSPFPKREGRRGDIGGGKSQNTRHRGRVLLLVKSPEILEGTSGAGRAKTPVTEDVRCCR